MKGTKTVKKLALNKKTVCRLNADRMTQVKGGNPTISFTCIQYCETTSDPEFCLESNWGSCPPECKLWSVKICLDSEGTLCR